MTPVYSNSGGISIASVYYTNSVMMWKVLIHGVKSAGSVSDWWYGVLGDKLRSVSDWCG